jgi:hypothetical protein
MSLIKVWTDLGGRKHVALLAKILEKSKRGVYTISYLSVTEDKDHGRPVYRYEDEHYEIDDEHICEYLNTSDEADAGYATTQETGWYVKQSDSDDDYVPSDDEESDDEESDVDEVDEEDNVEEEYE